MDDRQRVRVVKDGGIWWLQAPDGTKLLSKGVNSIRSPEGAVPPGAPEAYATWKARSLRRLRRWGFNTVGCWSDPGLREDGLYYTVVLHLGQSAGVLWWVDMWHQDFEASVRTLAQELTLPYRDDPNLIGYFLDNELGWYGDTLLQFALGWRDEVLGARWRWFPDRTRTVNRPTSVWWRPDA